MYMYGSLVRAVRGVREAKATTTMQYKQQNVFAERCVYTWVLRYASFFMLTVLMSKPQKYCKSPRNIDISDVEASKE